MFCSPRHCTSVLLWPWGWVSVLLLALLLSEGTPLQPSEVTTLALDPGLTFLAVDVIRQCSKRLLGGRGHPEERVVCQQLVDGGAWGAAAAHVGRRLLQADDGTVAVDDIWLMKNGGGELALVTALGPGIALEGDE